MDRASHMNETTIDKMDSDFKKIKRFDKII